MRKSNELANAEANELRIARKIRVADLVSVIAFHEDKMVVDVKPLVKREVSVGYISPPPILAVKIANLTQKIQIDGKTAEIKVDIKPGDIGIVVYLDLDSDNSIRTGFESQPNSARIHSGDDAVFVGVIHPG